MRQWSFLRRLILSYFCLILLMTCVSYGITRQLMKSMRSREVQSMQLTLKTAMENIDDLFSSYALRSAYLGTRTALFRGNVLSSSVKAQEAISVLSSSLSSDASIIDVFAYYDTGNVYCAHGLTRLDAFCGGHHVFSDEDALRLDTLLADGSKRFECFEWAQGEHVLLFHCPVRAVGQQAAVSINFILNDDYLRRQIGEALSVPGTRLEITSASGAVIAYGGSKRHNLQIEVLSEYGLAYRAYFDENALFAERIRLERFIWLITCVMTAAAMLVAYWLAVRGSRPVRQLNQLANTYAASQQNSVSLDEFVNIESQLRFLYIQQMNLLETNRMLNVLQRQQTAILLFHGCVTAPGEIERYLSAVSYAPSEMYYYLELLIVAPQAEQAADHIFADSLYEKSITEAHIQYVLLIELPNSDSTEELRRAESARQARQLNGLLETHYSAVYDELCDISRAYQSLVAYQSANQSGSSGNISRQVAWSDVFTLLDAYGQAIQSADLPEILNAFTTLRDKTQAVPSIATEIRHEVLIRTSFYLLHVEESTPKSADMLCALNRIPDMEENRFWNELKKTLIAFFSVEEPTDHIQKAVEYITRDFCRYDLNMEEAAEKVGLEKHYFSKKFKDVTGSKYIDFLSDLRMKEAKRLIEETDMRTAGIAEAVGYLDPANFRKKFQAYWGYSIQEYRQHIKENA